MILPLLASILALGLGPLLYAHSRGRWAAAGVDAFALVGVGGLVAVHVLPQSFMLAGWVVIPAVLIGLFGPGLLCGSRLFAGKSSGRVTMPVALLGIALHAVLDGVALTSPAHAGETAGLAAAVVLHRLPVGLGIWWLARPLYGRAAALGLLGAIAVFSVVGYAFGEPLIQTLSSKWIAIFQALIAGSLLHVILRHPPALPGGSKGSDRLVSGLGGLLGVGLILGIENFRAHAPAVGQHIDTVGTKIAFLELALQSAPALLVAYITIALVHAWNIDLSKLLGRGGTLSQALRGTAAGLPVPICSCGVIPLYRSLIVSGVPAPAAMSFLVATPELGFAALFLSWSLLGGEITLIRAASAAVLALAVGLLVGRRAPLSPTARAAEDATGPQTAEPLGARLARGFRYGFGDMIDGTAPWILAGLGLAAAAGDLLSFELFAELPAGLEVPLFALAGLPLYVCASGSTPLAAVLVAKGVSPGAAIAFLLTGPATNLTTFGVLGQLHSRRTALLFGTSAVFFTVLLGYASNALLSGVAAQVPERLHAEHAGVLEVGSLVALGLLFAVSLLRQGTRGFVGQVISPHGEEGHGHDHEGHDHCDEGVAVAHAHVHE